MEHLERTKAERFSYFVRKSARRWGTWIRRLPRPNLLVAVMGASLLGVGIAWLAAVFLGSHLNIGSQKTAPIDLTRLSLTIAAGVGGVVALVVAYRRQLDLEQGRFVERFGAAAKQLGDTDVAVRIAGVYAMAGVADQTRKLKRQQCIDVLCGYLRLPYSPEMGNNHQTQRVQKKLRLRGGAEEESHFEYRQNDKEVRQTIVRVIAEHLQTQSRSSWSDCNFDFTGAYLEDAGFHLSTFSGETTSFEGATFSGETTSFEGATFSGKYTSFVKATFSGQNTSFVKATFSGQNTWFNDATFSDKEIRKQTRFDGATFSGKNISFDGVTFSSRITWFDWATFSGNGTSFVGATFSGNGTSFVGATFSSNNTWFDWATFSSKGTWFDEATFSGENTSFNKAGFGNNDVSFANPRRWNPAPIFDWDDPGDDDPSVGKPNNVKPDEWPPVEEPVASTLG